MIITTGQYGKDFPEYKKIRISNGKGFGEIDGVWRTVFPDANDLHAGLSREEFSENYLNKLNYKRNTILEELEKIQKNLDDKKGIVVLCYERHGEFCHRKLFYNWLKDNILDEDICFIDEGFYSSSE